MKLGIPNRKTLDILKGMLDRRYFSFKKKKWKSIKVERCIVCHFFPECIFFSVVCNISFFFSDFRIHGGIIPTIRK